MNNEESTTTIIKATAHIEYGHEKSGSEIEEGWDSLETYINKKQGKGELTPEFFMSPYRYKCIVNLLDTPVFEDQIQNLDPNLRTTRGMYCIKYIPSTDKRRKKGRPWMIGQDMIRFKCHVAGKTHFKELCKRVPELDWIRRNSFFNDRLFDLAAMHPGVTFWFSVDWVTYEEKLQKQVQEHFNMYLKPFVAHVISQEEFKKNWSNKTVLLREFNDILKEINDAERLPSVQKEMIESTGEVYDRSRKCPRDPKTGRIVSKNKKEEE